ncbi:MAG: hypothetical protein ACI4JJ_05545 [Huintestinicola sp.]
MDYNDLKIGDIIDDTPVDVTKLSPNTMTDKEFEEYRKRIREENKQRSIKM